MTLEKFSQNLKLCTSERQLKEALWHYLRTFKITSYAFTLYSGHTKSGRQLKYHCVSESLRDWHNFYLEQGYSDLDRTLEESHSQVLPVFWDVHKQLEVAKNNRERQIRQESINYGIDKGLSLPVHGPNLDFATLTLHQFKQEKCLENHSQLQYEWLSAATIFYSHVTKFFYLDLEASTSHLLTKREKQCLNFTAKMWRIEQIAKELEISPRTVNFHIQNANKKLGVNSKYQALNKII